MALSFVHRRIPVSRLRGSGSGDNPQSLYVLILLPGAYGVIFEKDLVLMVSDVASVSPGLDICPDPTYSTSLPLVSVGDSASNCVCMPALSTLAASVYLAAAEDRLGLLRPLLRCH